MSTHVEGTGVYGGANGRWRIPRVKVSVAVLGFDDLEKM